MRAEIAYAELISRTREQSLLASCAELLAWDEDTYMPPAGAEHRAAQLALLAGLQHARETDPRLGSQGIDRSRADLILAVDGKAVRTLEDLLTEVEKKRPGERAVFSILREGEKREVAVGLEQAKN